MKPISIKNNVNSSYETVELLILKILMNILRTDGYKALGKVLN